MPDGTLYIIDEADDLFKNLHLVFTKESEITGFAKLLNSKVEVCYLSATYDN